jgi:hypothetical protein
MIVQKEQTVWYRIFSDIQNNIHLIIINEDSIERLNLLALLTRYIILIRHIFSSETSAVCDRHGLLGLAISWTVAVHLVDNIFALDYLAEDDMLAV